MNLKRTYLFVFASLMLLLYSCDNEVELTADYEDTTVVYGLLNANADTQFLRISRAFLEANTNALILAKDTSRLFYDSLNVRMVNTGNGQVFPFKTIEKPKDPGIFSDEKNILYYTDTNLLIGANYRLFITQPDGKQVESETRVLDTVQIERPEISSFRVRPLPLTNINGSILDYNLEFRHSSRVARFEVYIYFNYLEQIGSERIPKSIKIPLGTYVNRRLIDQDDATIELRGERFYRAIANAIDPSNRNPKLVDPKNNIAIEIYASDVIFDQYRSVYGPINGLAQVRPEYTNIENGIGLFASRSRTFARTFLSDPSRQQLRTGGITGNLNFQDL